MKKIIIQAQVPDLYDEKRFAFEDFVNYAQHKVKLQFEILHRPTDEEIHANAVKYHQSMGAGWTGVDFEAGAKWLCKQIFGKEKRK